MRVKCLSNNVANLVNKMQNSSCIYYTKDIDTLLSMKREELAEFLAITNYIFQKSKSDVEFI